MQDFLVLIDFLMEKNAKCKKHEKQYLKTIKRLNRKIDRLVADNEELRNQLDNFVIANEKMKKQLQSYIGGPRYDADEMGG